MNVENSHPLVQLLAKQSSDGEPGANQEALQSLQETLEQVGIQNLANVDLDNLREALHLPVDAMGELAQATTVAGEQANDQFHLFARTIPFKSSQVAGGSNPMLPGSLSQTLGPFVFKRRPPLWLDFIRVQRAVALWVQGNPTPLFYFNIQLLPLQASIPRLDFYNILPNSVWVRANLFNNNVPADLYAGLRISSGTLRITGNFTTSQSGIVLVGNTAFTCDLQLEQKAPPANLPTAPYGMDAREMTLQLPTQFSFTNRGAQRVGAIAATVYNTTVNCNETNQPTTTYFSQQQRLGLLMALEANPVLAINQVQSPLMAFSGSTPVNQAWWALPLAQVLAMQPLEAEGNGALLLETGAGLSASLQRSNREEITLLQPQILMEPGRINITDTLSNGEGKTHLFSLWHEAGKNFGTDVTTWFLSKVPFVYNTLASGNEIFTTQAGFDIAADRPLNIRGEAVALRSRKGTFMISASEDNSSLMLIDNTLLTPANQVPGTPPPPVQKMALALSNALLTTTLPVAVTLQATLSPDLASLTRGEITIVMGLFAYLPTLPDPYAANLGIIKRQFQRTGNNFTISNNMVAGTDVWMWVLAMVRWDNTSQRVTTSFELVDFFQHALSGQKVLPFTIASRTEIEARRVVFMNPLPVPPASGEDKGKAFTDKLITSIGIDHPGARGFSQDVTPVFADFSLLDVSSNANQMGIAFSNKLPYLQQLASGRIPFAVQSNSFPLKIVDNAMVTAGRNAQAFTLPGISWEPLLNLSFTSNEDPLPGFNYFPNDGVPTVIGNLASTPVELAPIPLVNYLTTTFQHKKDGKTYALFNLPFGMVAFAILDQQKLTQKTKPSIETISPQFEQAIVGGIQLELTAGSSFDNDNGQGLFEGYTFQLANLFDQTGQPAKSTLGLSPTKIFNDEFTKDDTLSNRPGVPVTEIGISGYGTSMASKWGNEEAIFSQVSKAEFNVYTGRTSHELVQVVSKEYPFGAKLVRTITIFRMSNGYVARVDSGWKAQTPGLYDFSYMHDVPRIKKKSPFTFHPGIVKGVFNIRNIKEVENGVFRYLGEELQAITYDADILLDNVETGGSPLPAGGATQVLVPSSGVLGYIQLSPPGVPISLATFTELLRSKGGSIGGSINGVIKLAGTDQRMRVNRFDVAASVNGAGAAVFVSSARGSVFLPKDGSWSLVQHTIGNGNVTPLPSNFSVPLIREGERPSFDVNGRDLYNPLVEINPATLHRIADPANMFVTDPTAKNYGFLQNMGSQKVLFLTPAFKTGVGKLMSKTPPLLADSFRLLKGSAIFPNIGDAITQFGEAVVLLKAGADGVPNSVDAFKKSGLQDLGKDVYELLDIHANMVDGRLLDQGYELAKKGIGNVIDKALKFDLPSSDFNLVNLPGKLVIALRYKASSKPRKDGPRNDYPGKCDFDVNSLAASAADNWKGKMNNLSVVVSVGPLKELMTVKGNFNSQKGKELDLGSNSEPNNLPTPEISFSDAVEPVIRILELLASLSTGDYAATLKKGLKIAMSNSGDIWEYKMEASKEIPMVRFPPGPAYDSPQVPLKLECSLAVGFNLNAALKVTTDPTQLLPTAGAFFTFRGRLMVMCVSVGAGSVFAIGEAGIRLEADTSPQVGVILHFGFGAQISVGLPVVGTASVTFMVGVEVATNSNGKIAITAFMLFKGQAELLGGLVCICIMIEARGTVIKDGPGLPANCEVQVTFAIDVSIFLVINIHFSESWSESRQIA